MEKKRVEDDDIIDLVKLFWDVMKGLRTTWWLIPFLMVLAIAGGLAVLTIGYSPMYEAKASFTVSTGNGEAGMASYSFNYDRTTASQMSKTFPYLLESSLLNDAILEELGVDEINGSLNASVLQDSNLVTMSAVSDRPEDATAILEAAIKVYPDAARFVLGKIRLNMIEQIVEPSEPCNQIEYLKTGVKLGAAGAFLAFMIIFLMAFFKKTLQKPEELRPFTNLEVISSIPNASRKARGKKQGETLSIQDARIASGYRDVLSGLYARVEREMKGRNAKVLMVTSAKPGEGKSSVALNLAYNAAKHGKKVLLIDGDLHKQNLGMEIFGERTSGLESLCLNERELKFCIRQDKKTGMYFLGGQEPVQNSARILYHAHLPEIIKECRECMDMVIVDTPPCLAFGDAAVWADFSDCSLYVLRYDWVEKKEMKKVLMLLEDVRAELIGCVFNRVPSRGGKYGYYSYQYGRYGYGYGRYGTYGGTKSRMKENKENS